MKRLAPILLLLLTVTPPLRAQARLATLAREVFVAESSFAATMADRDLARFATFVATEAVFFDRERAIRGKAAVVESWRPLFDGPTAPFAWKPAQIEVLESGTLALSSGPVLDRSGRQTGTFNSIWRREPTGEWKVVFDKGCPVCNCARAP